MNVLVIGNGGREHAILLALKKSKRVEKLYCMKGNAGTAQIAENVNVDYMNVGAVKAYVSAHPEIDYIVVAPDDPLALGLVDELEAMGKRCFGPRKNAAVIEASKAFSKNLMKKYGIPTAEAETFTDYDKALEYVRRKGAPIVLKADGLALGKGVLVCNDLKQAEEGLKEIMLDKTFGSAGNVILIEECMRGLKYTPGEEVSVLAFCDGKTIVPMITACDHKRANDGDKGLNTGGMGTFSPCPFWTKELETEVYEKIMLPTMNAMNAEGRTFKGCLYFGLMRTDKGMKVVEYNSRFGDPETQVILPMLKTDLLDIFEAVTDESGAVITQALIIDFGAVISAIVSFLLTALVLFLIVKAVNGVRAKGEKLKEESEKPAEEVVVIEECAKPEAQPAPAVNEETSADLLREIRDLLKAQNQKPE